MLTKTISRVPKNIKHLIQRKPAFLFTEILLTYYCPQKCLQCDFPNRAKGTKPMTFEDFRLIIDRLDQHGTHGIVLSGGDPIVHPQLFDFVSYLAKKDFTYLHILSTLFASKEKVKGFVDLIIKNKTSITCSFDGLGEIADTLRGADNVSAVVLENIKYLHAENKRANNPIKTAVNVVINQLNLEQIPEIISYFNNLGWIINVDIFRNYKGNSYEHLVVADFEKFAEIIRIIKSFPKVHTPHWILDGYVDYLQGNFPKHCPYLTSPGLGSKFFVQPNGDVEVCQSARVGNLLKQTPQEITNSKRWKNQITNFEVCQGCWNTCYTLPAKLSNYLNLKEFDNIYRLLKTNGKN